MSDGGRSYQSYFKVDVECHIVGSMRNIDYYPGVNAWWKGIAGVTRPLMAGTPPDRMPPVEEMTRREDPEAIIEFMDAFGVDVACILPEPMMDTTGYATRWVTNGEVLEFCSRYPDRLLPTPNVGPFTVRGLKNVLWELEYLARERDCRCFKFYPCEDTYINDREIWPYYEKLCELDIPVFIHTGWCWCPPGLSKYSLPVLLDEVATCFPELKVVAFHAGWPHCQDLNMVAATHENVYIGLNLLMPWAGNAPWTFARIIGDAIRFAGVDRVVCGSDYAGFGVQIRAAAVLLADFQIPEDMQKGYGYTPLSEGDKEKIYGKNLAALLGIPAEKRI